MRRRNRTSGKPHASLQRVLARSPRPRSRRSAQQVAGDGQCVMGSARSCPGSVRARVRMASAAVSAPVRFPAQSR